MTNARHPDFVQPLSPSPGIYFDRLGKLSIVKGELNVVSYVEVSYLKPHLVNLKEILGTLRFVCQQSENNQCDFILSPLTVRYNAVKQEYDSMSHLISNRNKREAWFGAVGTVFKHVFGTLDEDDALKYDYALESVQKDEKKLAQLMKENILVTTSALNSFNKSINILKANENSLNSVINQLLNHTNNITKITSMLTLETKINSIFSNLESSLLTLSFQLEDLTNAILLSSQNILHPSIVTPAQLYRELANNDRHLPADSLIPLSLSLNNIHLILSISTVSCYYYKDKLVFVLHVPLVTSEEFNLYHSIALPTPHDVEKLNTFSLVVPSNPFIAISKDKTCYCNMNSLNECKTLASEFYLCHISKVLLSSGISTCESELLTKTIGALPTQCHTKTIFGELDVWNPLKNNQWIYVQSRSSKITIDCVTEVRELVVSGSGLLTIPERCTVYTKNARLISSNSAINLTIPIPSLDFSIVNDSCCKLEYKSYDAQYIQSHTLLQNLDLNDLTINNPKEKLLSELDKIIEGQPLIVKYGTYYLSFISIVLIIILCFVIFKLYKRISKSKSKLIVSFVKATPSADDVAAVQHEDSPTPVPRLREVV